MTGDALGLLMDAVGSDLRELAAAASQLVSDSGGQVDADAVRALPPGPRRGHGLRGRRAGHHRRPDGARSSRCAGRWTPASPHVLLADALADAVRTVARVSAAGRGDPYAMASSLKMPPWKVRKAQGQASGLG